MNNALMFSKASDEWSTPDEFFAALDAEFGFDMDMAASAANTKCNNYAGLDREHPRYQDALGIEWDRLTSGQGKAVCWLNPPYSRCREFIAKAAQEARRGATVVALVPSRTDTRWWHEHVWDACTNRCRPGVEVRFVKGRLKFGEGKNSAPFPSVVIVFRPPESA